MVCLNVSWSMLTKGYCENRQSGWLNLFSNRHINATDSNSVRSCDETPPSERYVARDMAEWNRCLLLSLDLPILVATMLLSRDEDIAIDHGVPKWATPNSPEQKSHKTRAAEECSVENVARYNKWESRVGWLKTLHKEFSMLPSFEKWVKKTVSVATKAKKGHSQGDMQAQKFFREDWMV